MTTSLRISNLTLTQNQQIVVEFRRSPHLGFAFKFNKNEKLVIGTCEWCNSKNILRVVCKCKNVRYCN